MSKSSLQSFIGTTLLAGFTALLISCGSDPAGTTSDTTPPTVVITDDVAAATATGDVVFTFTFSEPVTTAFTAASVNVAGATKGAFTPVSATVYTLVTSPALQTSGTITVTVPAGGFTDLAGNQSTTSATASQAFDTQTADTTPPTVVITDNVAGATATGDVLFTFTFSEPITSSFTAASVTVSGATKGTFTQVSSTVSTLVASPAAGTTGTIQVTVPVGAFSDVAGNKNTASATASQAFNTLTPDTTPPTVVITDNVAAATATGDVLFTFTFSEPITSSFTAASVTVSGASKGTFTQVSSTVSTLVTSPATGTTGTITVTVPVGAFSDLAGNKNTASATASQPFSSQSAFQLVWSDEFETPGAPDAAKWRFETGPNWSNGELQDYTNNSKNARVEGGSLVIEAINETVVDQGQTRNYTSARLNSLQSWTYGRMEIRAKLPKGKGLWPAIWMMGTDIGSVGWPACGELDIMEQNYNWTTSDTAVLGTIHCPAHYGANGKGGRTDASSPSTDWHVYAMEWYDGEIRFFVDDNQYFTYYTEGTAASWPFNTPFYFLLNIAIDPTTDVATWTKRTMEIDYVRVYSGPTTPPVAPAQSLPGRIEAESYVKMLGVQTEACTDTGGTLDVGYTDPTDWMDYHVNVATAGTYTIRFRVAAQTATTNFDCLVDGAQALNVSFPPTGGWQTWTTIEKSITLPAGDHTLRLAITTGGFNLNWFEVVAP